MDNVRKSFLLYTSFYRPLQCLSDEQFGRLFRAVFQYQLGEDPEVASDIAMAFEFIKAQFEIDGVKYQARVERNRENGRRGGAPKGNSNARKFEDSECSDEENSETTETTENNPKQPKQPKQADDDDDDVDDDVNNTQSVCCDVKRARRRASSTNTSPHTDFPFFFSEMWKRNIPNPAYETQRFLDHYEVVEWTLEGGAKLDTDAKRLAKLRQWVPESTGKRFPEGFVTAWLKLAQRAPNAELKADMFDDRVEAIMSGTGVNTPILKCSSALRQWIMAPDNKAAQDAILAGWLKGKSGLKVNPYD
jgi:hypothetical protein